MERRPVQRRRLVYANWEGACREVDGGAASLSIHRGIGWGRSLRPLTAKLPVLGAGDQAIGFHRGASVATLCKRYGGSVTTRQHC